MVLDDVRVGQVWLWQGGSGSFEVFLVLKDSVRDYPIELVTLYSTLPGRSIGHNMRINQSDTLFYNGYTRLL